MNDLFMRMVELSRQGFFCSQIILIMGLEARGGSNPELIRAATALAGGLGFSGGTCGALSGAACLIGLFAGKGGPEEEADDRLDDMIGELVRWFEAENARYGGSACRDIIEGVMANRPSRCPPIVLAALEKAIGILEEHGYAWSA